eukprot:14613112-Alexandrium_andersonii.AAC.1
MCIRDRLPPARRPSLGGPVLRQDPAQRLMDALQSVAPGQRMPCARWHGLRSHGGGSRRRRAPGTATPPGGGRSSARLGLARAGRGGR